MRRGFQDEWSIKHTHCLIKDFELLWIDQVVCVREDEFCLVLYKHRGTDDTHVCTCKDEHQQTITCVWEERKLTLSPLTPTPPPEHLTSTTIGQWIHDLTYALDKGTGCGISRLWTDTGLEYRGLGYKPYV